MIKVSRTESYGATVVITGNNYDDAFDACKLAVDNAKGTLIHPFDDPFVIAGKWIANDQLDNDCKHFIRTRHYWTRDPGAATRY